MARLYANNFSTTLNGAITDVATSMTLTSVTGFPAVGSGDTAQVTLSGGGNIEVVTATAISGSVITITRAQEGTSGVAFSDGDTVEIRITALSHTDVLAADLTPVLAGPLDASGTYIGFGGSSTSTAYCINHAGNIPKLIGAANYYWGFTTSSNIYAQAGTSWNSITFTNDSTRLVIKTNNSERMQVDDNGVNISNGTLVVNSNNVWADGISFDAGTNVLDEYEEGTWTATVDFATTGDLSVVYTSQTGWYKRVGNMVTGGFNLACTPTFTTASGELRINTLPFTSSSGIEYGTGQSANASSTFAYGSGRTTTSLLIVPSATKILIQSSGSATSSSTLSASSITSGASMTLIANFVYYV